MKTAAIVAAVGAGLLSGVSATHNDPCAGFQEKACHSTPTCVWTQHTNQVDYDYDYDNWYTMSRSAKDRKSYGKEFRFQGCSMEHVTDRVEPKVSHSEKEQLAEWGMHSTWDTIECEEAFSGKDCTDINQKHSNKCEWECGLSVCKPFVVDGFEAGHVPVQVAKARTHEHCALRDAYISVADAVAESGCVEATLSMGQHGTGGGVGGSDNGNQQFCASRFCFGQARGGLKIGVDCDWDGNYSYWFATVLKMEAAFLSLQWNHFEMVNDSDEEDYTDMTDGGDLSNECYFVGRIKNFHSGKDTLHILNVVGLLYVADQLCTDRTSKEDFAHSDMMIESDFGGTQSSDWAVVIKENMTPTGDQTRALRSYFSDQATSRSRYGPTPETRPAEHQG